MGTIALKFDINTPPLTITNFMRFISVLLHAISCYFVSYEGFWREMYILSHNFSRMFQLRKNSTSLITSKENEQNGQQCIFTKYPNFPIMNRIFFGL